MLVDARAAGEAGALEADVCVVGAGPAGITLALELARLGCRVCLLESGGRAPADAPGELSGGKSVGYLDYPPAGTQGRARGGGARPRVSPPPGAAARWRA